MDARASQHLCYQIDCLYSTIGDQYTTGGNMVLLGDDLCQRRGVGLGILRYHVHALCQKSLQGSQIGMGAIVNTGAIVESYNGITLTKANLVNTAFSMRFGWFGSAFIAVSITLFAFSTVLGWVHYGTKSTEYLLGE
jgi:hypothetical protein